MNVATLKKKIHHITMCWDKVGLNSKPWISSLVLTLMGVTSDM